MKLGSELFALSELKQRVCHNIANILIPSGFISVGYHKIDSLPMFSRTLCRTGVPDFVDPDELLLAWELNPLSVLFVDDPEL